MGKNNIIEMIKDFVKDAFKDNSTTYITYQELNGIVMYKAIATQQGLTINKVAKHQCWITYNNQQKVFNLG